MSNLMLLIISWISVMLLTGCTMNPNKQHMIPQQGLTVQQIYQHSGTGSHHDAGHTDDPYGYDHGDDELASARVAAHGTPSVKTADHTAVASRLSPQPSHEGFKQIQNPSIPIYIMPHLVRMGEDEVPVAGYSTAFFLYAKNHYALPWEQY